MQFEQRTLAVVFARTARLVCQFNARKFSEQLQRFRKRNLVELFGERDDVAADAAATVKKASEVADDDLILDIGPETAARLAAQLKAAGTIVWNGPVGVFEFAAFENGTKAIAQAIAESPAFSIAGGGDTLAAIAKYGIEEKVGYISTGGGAFLEVLEGKTLPAFEILEKRAAA